MTPPSVLIGIVTHNRADLLPRAIESALAQGYPHKQVAVYDDASTDETPALAARFPQVRWQRTDQPLGYMELRNRLMRETDAPFFLSLDDDAWFLEPDAIARGVERLTQRPETAAIAYDILWPTDRQPRPRAAPRPAAMFIGCGHLLRLAAVRAAGFYAPAPGYYGGEEKDLCVRLLDAGAEVELLPGVHVWHEKTPAKRDWQRQNRSGVCNDLAFALRRCPAGMLWWMLPAKAANQLRFALPRGLALSWVKGMGDFLRALPAVLRQRRAVSTRAYREFTRRLRLRS